jgi:prepilin-type N-terminal cleavage/methylation domain-containing protein
MQVKKKSGFTLIEMAIVLVIIGLILAAVMKGGDIYHSAQIDRVNKGFFEAWKTVVYEYYDRRGQYLGDGVVNGGNSGNPANGQFDGFLTLGNVVDPGLSNPEREAFIDIVRNSGIDICTMIQTDREDLPAAQCSGKNIFQRNVSGAYTGKEPVEVGFYTCETGDAASPVERNCLVFTEVPIDVAQRLDTYYDGQPDGRQGNIRATLTTSPIPNPITVGAYQDFAAGGRSDRYNLVMILQF